MDPSGAFPAHAAQDSRASLAKTRVAESTAFATRIMILYGSLKGPRLGTHQTSQLGSSPSRGPFRKGSGRNRFQDAEYVHANGHRGTPHMERDRDPTVQRACLTPKPGRNFNLPAFTWPAVREVRRSFSRRP